MVSSESRDVEPLVPSTSRPTREVDARRSPAELLVGPVLALVSARPEELKQVLAASPHALIAFDVDRRIVHANRGAEELFGYGPGTLDGASTDVLVAERFRQPDAPPMVAAPHVLQVELAGVRRDGTEIAIEWAFASTTTPRGLVFVMMVRDRDAVDRAIDALRASEERFRLLVEEVREYAIFTLDEAGRVSSWNKGAERCEGWTSEEIIGQPYDLFFTPEDRAAELRATFSPRPRAKGVTK